MLKQGSLCFHAYAAYCTCDSCTCLPETAIEFALGSREHRNALQAHLVGAEKLLSLCSTTRVWPHLPQVSADTLVPVLTPSELTCTAKACTLHQPGMQFSGHVILAQGDEVRS